MSLKNKKLFKKLNKYLISKSIHFLLILALVWQFCFPRLTSWASTVPDQADLSNPDSQIMEQELSPEEQVVNEIKQIAKEENYQNVSLLIGIATAESHLNPNVRGEVDSRDRGLYQINKYYNPEVSDECAFDVGCSTKWAIQELKAGHAWKWNASKYKWGKNLAKK